MSHFFKNKKRGILLWLLLPFYGGLAQTDLAKYIHPMVGTGGTGHTFPGPCSPFGMVQLSPDTRIDGSWEGCSGYHHSDTVIYGFSHTHLSGTGCSDLGDFAWLPVYYEAGKNMVEVIKKGVAYSHQNEIANAGYYKVLLRNQISVELTTTARTGWIKLTFSKAGKICLGLNLEHRDKLLDAGFQNAGDLLSFSGFRRSKAWALDQFAFFYSETSKKPSDIEIVKNAAGIPVQALLYFDVAAGEELTLKSGISNVSEQGAQLNLKREGQTFDFENVRKRNYEAWNLKMHDIEVFGGTETELDKFYTALYHCMIHPSVLSDADSTYRGRDGKIHKAEWGHYYTIFSLWDTYRALHPLLNTIEPATSLDFLNTFAAQYQQSGRLPKWELWGNETDCMIGLHAIPVIADALRKNLVKDKKLYNILLEASVAELLRNDPELNAFRKKGYLEVNDCPESVSKTLELAYDFSFFRYGTFPNKLDTIKSVAKRVNSGMFSLYNASSGFFQPVLNATWNPNFDPFEVNNHYTEANAWQYSILQPSGQPWNYPDINLVQAIFRTNPKTSGREQADITGMIGQYAHGNEPSHHILSLLRLKDEMLFDSVLNIIKDSFYTNRPNGLIGNEDCGQMSAWYLFHAMGFYPSDLQTQEYTWGNSRFDAVQIKSGARTIKMHLKPETMPDSVRNLFNWSDYADSYMDLRSQEKYAKKIQLYDNLSFQIKEDINDYVIHKSNLDTRMLCVPRPYSYIEKAVILNSAANGYTLNKKDSMALENGNLLIAPNGNMSSTHRLQSLKELDSLDSAILYNNFSLENSLELDSIYKHFEVNQIINSAMIPEKITDTFFSYWTNPRVKYQPYKIQVLIKPLKSYRLSGDSALIDGKVGTKAWRTGNWMGFQGKDFECILENINHLQVSQISLRCLHDMRSWIMYPKEIYIYGSKDGRKFKSLGKSKLPNMDTMTEISVQNQVFNIPKKKFNYYKIVVKNYGKLPDWHPGKKEDSILFIDEITLK